MISSLYVLPTVGVPATRAPQAAGYTELRQLAGARRADLAYLHGMGPKGLGLIEDALKEHGLNLC